MNKPVALLRNETGITNLSPYRRSAIPMVGVIFIMTTLLEHNVRFILGQRLSNSTDNKFHADHLRFDMGGERDSTHGLESNIYLLSLFFHLPVTVRNSYHYKDAIPGDYKHILTFHKGEGILWVRDENNILIDIEGYGGIGTVGIIMRLINITGVQKYYNR